MNQPSSFIINHYHSVKKVLGSIGYERHSKQSFNHQKTPTGSAGRIAPQWQDCVLSDLHDVIRLYKCSMYGMLTNIYEHLPKQSAKI